MLEKYTVLRVEKRVPAIFLHIYSLILVTLGWGIFYFEDFGQMRVFFNSIFGGSAFTDVSVQSQFLDNFWLWIAAIVLCLPVRNAISKIIGKLFTRNPEAGRTATIIIKAAFAAAVLFMSAALLVGATNNAFLYTRF